MNAENEVWKDIETFEGLYQTNGTQVRSLDREIFNPYNNKKMLLKGKILRACKVVRNEKYYKLSKGGYPHSLSISFIKFLASYE
jgi:hypothetical protein